MAVSKRLRYEILRRDANTCRYCGAKAPDVPLRVDHVTPVALGGSDHPSNLATACEPCNSGKSSASPDATHVAAVSDDALRWSAAMKKAAENLTAQQQPRAAYREFFNSSWRGWTKEDGAKTVHVDLPDNWKSSLDTFYESGLPQEVWPDIVEKAMTNPTVAANNVFRYACGIAWRMVRELQERAGAIVGAEPAMTTASLTPLGRALVALWTKSWTSEHGEKPSGEALDSFTQSVVELGETEQWLRPEMLVEAAQMGGAEQIPTINKSIGALTERQRSDIVIDWIDAWTDLAIVRSIGELPDNSSCAEVKNQVIELADHGVSLDRIRRAAVLAGYHHSTELHHGLRRSELHHTGVDAYRHLAGDAWSRSFHAASSQWPTPEERGAFLDQVDQVVSEGLTYLNDLVAAADSAGAYQDPNLRTCLPRGLSALTAATQPLEGAH